MRIVYIHKNMSLTKVCIDCKQEKEVNLFYKRGKNSEKYQGHCKACANERAKIRRKRLKAEGYSGNHNFKLGRAPYNAEKEKIRREKYKHKRPLYSRRQALLRKQKKNGTLSEEEEQELRDVDNKIKSMK